MKLRYIHFDTDRHGKQRVYFRRAVGCPKVRMRHKFNTKQFHMEYAALLGNSELPEQAPADLSLRGFVYFWKQGPYIKIGFSTKPAGRLRDLTGSHPSTTDFIIIFPGTLRDEQRFHAALKKHRANGEWFNDVQAVRMAALRSVTFGRPMHDDKTSPTSVDAQKGRISAQLS